MGLYSQARQKRNWIDQEVGVAIMYAHLPLPHSIIYSFLQHFEHAQSKYLAFHYIEVFFNWKKTG